MNAGLINGNVLASDYVRAISEPLAVKTMTAKLIKEGFSKTEAAQLTKQIRSNLVRSLSGLPSGALVSDAMVYSRMGNLKTGILGKLATKGGAFEKAAIESLWGVSTYSPLGKSSANFNATRPISEVLATVSAKAKSQSMVAPLRNLQKLHPTMELPVVVDGKGNIVGYVRPEISSKTGKITGTQNMGLLGADGKFSAARLGRGGGRKLTLPKSVLKAAEDTLLGTNVVAVSTKEGVAKKGGKFQPNTGQNTKPLPTGAKTTSGVASDNRLRVLKPGESVYKAPARRFIGRADAPMYGPRMEDGSFTTSQSEAAAEKRAKNKLQSEKANRAVGALTALTFAASFAGGSVGKMAEKILPFVFILQAMTALMQVEFAKMSAMQLATVGWVAAIVLVAGTLAFLNKKMQDAAKAQQKYVDATNHSTARMKKVGELTNKVGASELAAKKRSEGTSDKYLKGFDRAGQQFGTNFLDSEIGKETLSNFKLDLATMAEQGISDGGTIAAKHVATQLAAYISDGVMTAEQANSVARAIGINMSDMTIYAEISGKLNELVGPDGVDILKNPLKVRLTIAEESAQDINTAAQVLKDTINKNTSGFSPGRWMDQFLNPFAGSTSEEITAAATAGALGGTNLEVIQAQKDAQNKMYDDQIAALQTQLETTKDKEKQKNIEQQISDLQGKKVEDEKKFSKVSKKTLEETLDAFDYLNKKTPMKLGPDSEGAYFKALNESLKAKYANDPMLNVLLDKSAATKDKNLEVAIKTVVKGGAISPGAAVKLMDAFGSDREAELNTLIKTTLVTMDPGKSNDLINLALGLKDKEIGITLLTEISSPDGADKLDDRLAVLMMLKKLDKKEINLDVFLKDPKKALAKIDALIPQLNKINALKGPITLDVVQTLSKTEGMPDLSALIADWEHYKNLPDTVKKQAIETYISIYKTIDETEAQKFINDKLKRAGGSVGVADYINKKYKNADGTVNVGAIAEQLNKELYAEGTPPNTIPKGSGTQDTGTKKRDTTLDDLLTRLKRTRDMTIDAEGGINELMRILGQKKDIKIFNGLDEQLARIKNSPDEFIDFIGGMEKAIQKGYIEVDKKNKPILDKNGNIKLTDPGKAARKGYQEASMGDYVANAAKAIVASQNQRAAMLKLTAAGMDSKEALDALSDSNFANAVAAATDKNEIKELAKAQKEQAAEADRTLRANDPVGYFQKYKDLAMERLNAEADFIRLSYEPKIKQQQLLVDSVNDEIRTKQRLLEVDGVLGQRRIDSINKEIDAMQHALQMGVEKQLSALSNQSSAYSEDLAIINHTVEGINKKYDKQEEALSKINDINKEIAQQQRQQLDLADALSQGDIAAAAKAAQAMRQSAADAAAQSASEMLKTAREAEIASVRSAGGLTADEIAERQYQIDRQSYQLNLQRQKTEETIANLQEQIYQINLQRETTLKSIQDLEDKIYNLTYNQVDGIDTLQKKMAALLKPIDDQKVGWEKAQNAIDLAQTSTDKFKSDIMIANGLLSTLAGLWQSIDKKTLAINLKMITDAIQGSDPMTNPNLPSDTNDAAIKAAEEKAAASKKALDEANAALKAATDRMDYLNKNIVLKDSWHDSVYQPAKDALAAAAKMVESAKASYDAAAKDLEALKAKAGGSTTPSTGTGGTGTGGTTNPPAASTPTYGVWDPVIGGVLGDPSKNHGSLVGITTGKDGKQYNSWSDGTWTPYVASTTASPVVVPDTGSSSKTDVVKTTPTDNITDTVGGGFFDGFNSLPGLGGLDLGLNIDYDMLNSIDWTAFAFSKGGIVPQYFANGGFSRGTDTIPAMLTPGEFVIRRKAVDKFGINNLNRINSGDMSGAPVYNYKVDVTLNGSNMDPNDVANAVMTKIKQVESKNIRRNTI